LVKRDLSIFSYSIQSFLGCRSQKEETDMAELKKGDRAPAFELEDQNGRRVKLADFKGRKLLVYFYPKADTPG
jgi:cytochrome oxidase Cu insertion factor (SCO1/SenC/PrrC family)